MSTLLTRGQSTRTKIFSIVDEAIAKGSKLLAEEEWVCDDEDVTVQELQVRQFDFDEPFGVTFTDSGEADYFETLDEALDHIKCEGEDYDGVMLHVMCPHPDYNHDKRSGYCDEAIIWWDKR